MTMMTTRMMACMIGTTLLLLGGCLRQVTAQEVMRRNSFTAPFEDYNHKGKRSISDWLIGGDATINQNYVRVTNDRASKRGFIYNQVATPSGEWTLELKFRISGQGQNLYGDGLALWVTSTPYGDFARGGSEFGAPSKLNGFGVLFDTYKNAEAGGKHKDIMLITNDGKKEMQMHEVLPTGCRSNYRLWEGRDDFVATKHSIAVIDFSDREKTVKVRIDEKGDGKLKSCFEFKFTDEGEAQLPDMSKMHIAISSSTGQLADNHDVISVQMKNFGDQTAGLVVPTVDPESIGSNVAVHTRNYVNAYVTQLEQKVKDLEHELEHRMDSITDELKNMIEKLREAEEDDKKRIDALTAKLSAEVTDKVLSETAGGISDVVGMYVDQSMETHARNMKSSIKDSIRSDISRNTKQMMEKVKNISGSDKSWIIPFLILSIAMCIVSGVAWSKWNRYMKTHLP